MGDLASYSEEQIQKIGADFTVGEILSRTRTHYGYSIEAVSNTLKIRQLYLEALEQDDVSNLPGRVYAIGFVRSYAEFLGLDGDKIVHMFKNQKVGHSHDNKVAMPVPVLDTHLPGKWTLGICFAGLLLLLVFGPKDRYVAIDQEILPPEVIALEEAIPEAPVIINESLIIKAHEESWIEITDMQGEVVYSSVLKAGAEYKVPQKERLSLKTGNAGGIEIVLDGEVLPSLGAKGVVLKDFALDRDVLKILQKMSKTAKE